MTTQEFLSENREEVINYYNNEVKNYWNVSLKDFMVDLLTNFRKVTTSEGLKRMDLMANLAEAKSRLGCFDTKIEVEFDRDAFIAKKYKETVFAQNLAL